MRVHVELWYGKCIIRRVSLLSGPTVAFSAGSHYHYLTSLLRRLKMVPDSFFFFIRKFALQHLDNGSVNWCPGPQWAKFIDTNSVYCAAREQLAMVSDQSSGDWTKCLDNRGCHDLHVFRNDSFVKGQPTCCQQ